MANIYFNDKTFVIIAKNTKEQPKDFINRVVREEIKRQGWK